MNAFVHGGAWRGGAEEGGGDVDREIQESLFLSFIPKQKKFLGTFAKFRKKDY